MSVNFDLLAFYKQPDNSSHTPHVSRHVKINLIFPLGNVQMTHIQHAQASLQQSQNQQVATIYWRFVF